MSLDKVIDFLDHLTVKRLILFTFAILIGIGGYILFEHRNDVYKELVSIKHQASGRDYYLPKPSEAGDKLFKRFIAKHPEVEIAALIDANQLDNTRLFVEAYFNNPALEREFQRMHKADPSFGDGPLFSNDVDLNRQVLNILNGEFSCGPANVGYLGRVFPEALRTVKYSCRVPLPPAFNAATGWITLHLNTWPLDNLEAFKLDALTLSLAYYDLEINPKKIIVQDQ